jgi:hypothetical protein
MQNTPSSVPFGCSKAMAVNHLPGKGELAAGARRDASIQRNFLTQRSTQPESTPGVHPRGRNRPSRRQMPVDCPIRPLASWA